MSEKEQFMSLYWGQKVLKEKGVKTLAVASNSSVEFFGGGKLELKSVDNIQEGDAFVLGDKFYPALEEGDKVSRATDAIQYLFSGKILTGSRIHEVRNFMYPQNVCELLDRLRLMGYAMPWGEHEVVDMIEFGWLKIVD